MARPQVTRAHSQVKSIDTEITRLHIYLSRPIISKSTLKGYRVAVLKGFCDKVHTAVSSAG